MESRDDSPNSVERGNDDLPFVLQVVEELILVASGVVAIVVAGFFLYFAIASHTALHDAQKYSSAQHSVVSSSAAVSGGAATSVKPGSAPGATAPVETPQSDKNDKCANFDPEKATLAEALGCFVAAVASGVAAGIIAGLKILYLLYVCIIIPIVALLLAWLTYELSKLLERNSRNCKKKRHWWQRLWCWVKRILYYVLIIVSVLLVIAAIVSVVLCIIALL